MKTVFFRLIICLIALTILESCSIFGIEKIIIRKSDFTYTDNDILFQGKLNSINIRNNEDIFFQFTLRCQQLLWTDQTKKEKNPIIS